MGVLRAVCSCKIPASQALHLPMSAPINRRKNSEDTHAAPQRAQAAIEEGRRIGAQTQRERDYLDAVAAYYQDWATRPEPARQQSRAQAFEALAARYPADDEAQIFHALYLASAQSLADQTYVASLKAAEMLERQFTRHPNHPGVAHYLIHCYDAPPIAAMGAAAWTAWAQGKPEEALSLMRRAADTEDKSEKDIMTPGRIMPGRELLGELLLELKRPAEALMEFEASQRREPERFRGVYGVAQAAAQSGDLAQAKRYFARLVEMAGQGDGRPELAQARAFLAANPYPCSTWRVERPGWALSWSGSRRTRHWSRKAGECPAQQGEGHAHAYRPCSRSSKAGRRPTAGGHHVVQHRRGPCHPGSPLGAARLRSTAATDHPPDRVSLPRARPLGRPQRGIRARSPRAGVCRGPEHHY